MRLSFREKDFLAVLCFLTAFLVFVFYRIETVQFGPDEAEIADKALAVRYGAEIFRDPLFFWQSIRIPGMVVFYTGSLTIYLSVPFLYLFEPSLVSMRIGFILCAAAGLISIYYCLRVWLGQLLALIAALVMSVNFSFLYAVRCGGENEELITIYLFWTGVALITYATKHQYRKKYTWLAGFLWGLGVFTKFLMLGYLLGLAIIWAVADKKTKTWVKQKVLISWQHTTAFILAFCIGAFPVINCLFITNRKNNPVTGFLILLQNIIYVNKGYDIIARIASRIKDIHMFFTDTMMLNKYDDLGRFSILTSLLLIIQGLVFFYIIGNKDTEEKHLRTITINTAILYSCIFATVCLVPHAQVTAHMISLFPLAQLTQILTLAILLTIKPAPLKYCCVFIFSCLLIINAASCIIYYSTHTHIHLKPPKKEITDRLDIIAYIKNHNLYPLQTSLKHNTFFNTLSATWALSAAHRYDPKKMRTKVRLTEQTEKQLNNSNQYYLLFTSTSEDPLSGLSPNISVSIEHLKTFRLYNGYFQHLCHVTMHALNHNEYLNHEEYIRQFAGGMCPVYNIPDKELI